MTKPLCFALEQSSEVCVRFSYCQNEYKLWFTGSCMSACVINAWRSSLQLAAVC